MPLKVRIRLICHRIIQCLNAVLIVSGQAMVAVSVALCLLCISKQLYLVQNQAAWFKAVVIASGVSLLNVILTIFMLILSRATKYSFFRIKQHRNVVYLCMRVETLVIAALALLANGFFRFYTGGHGMLSWQGDHWWVGAIGATWLISWFAVLTIALQLLTWRCYEKRGRDA